MQPLALNPEQRRAALARMRTQEFDLAVIGGGVTGSGVALDAATRGLSVALVEARDYAAGTSSRSSKLFHGGLRYLEQLSFGLVREALRERGLMLTTLCPHLARPIRFLYPLQHRGWERLYTGAGIALYDVMGGARVLPRHRHLTRRGALREAPALRPDALIGAIQYSDVQVDDARHTMMLARTAASWGAALATSARMTGFLREGVRVTGVEVRDLEVGGEPFPLRARQVVNATGVWTDEVQTGAGRGRIHVQASKGVHLVVPRDRIASDTGLILRTESSVLFVIPWPGPTNPGHWIIGTTDTPWELGKDHPAASRADIDYLLDHVNALLSTPLTHDDVEGVYAGLRPLLTGESEETSRLSREHAVSSPTPGLVSVAGGKYTTYRVMAADAVDAAVRGLDRRVPASCTADVPLVGASGFVALHNRRADLAAGSGLSAGWIEHLLGRYGTAIEELLAMVAQDPELGEPLPGAEDHLRVEILYAATHEGALHLDDVLTRRTRISIETFDRGTLAAAHVAALVGPVLGWDTATREREVAHYLARVAAERQSQAQHDDATADAARLGAPDVRGAVAT
jgi:glycerol-3-phosphate dehydrogenase